MSKANNTQPEQDPDYLFIKFGKLIYTKTFLERQIHDLDAEITETLKKIDELSPSLQV